MKKSTLIALFCFAANLAFGQDKLQAFSLNEVPLLDGTFKAAQQTDFTYNAFA